jgi:hypothetical protein
LIQFHGLPGFHSQLLRFPNENIVYVHRRHRCTIL